MGVGVRGESPCPCPSVHPNPESLNPESCRTEHPLRHATAAPGAGSGAASYDLEAAMADVYKSIELVGVSDEGFDGAVRAAVERANATVRDLEWLEVIEQRGYIRAGSIAEYQVKVRIWFKLSE